MGVPNVGCLVGAVIRGHPYWGFIIMNHHGLLAHYE